METEPIKAEPKRKRRWFQFSLRTLLIFMLIAAVPCAMLGWRIDRKRKEREAANAIVKKGGWVRYDYESSKNGLFRYDNANSKDEKPPGPDWLRELLGENFFSEVKFVGFDYPFVRDEDLAICKKFSALQSVALRDCTKVTDAGLANLNDLRCLQTIYLIYTPNVTDAGVNELRRAHPNCKIIQSSR